MLNSTPKFHNCNIRHPNSRIPHLESKLAPDSILDLHEAIILFKWAEKASERNSNTENITYRQKLLQLVFLTFAHQSVIRRPLMILSPWKFNLSGFVLISSFGYIYTAISTTCFMKWLLFWYQIFLELASLGYVCLAGSQPSCSGFILLNFWGRGWRENCIFFSSKKVSKP